jgi:hypothetical protein
MVPPVAAVHRGVAGEADGEGYTGRSYHQGRLREQHFTSLSKIDGQTDRIFCISLFGDKGTQLLTIVIFKEQSEMFFFPGYERKNV